MIALPWRCEALRKRESVAPRCHQSLAGENGACAICRCQLIAGSPGGPLAKALIVTWHGVQNGLGDMIQRRARRCQTYAINASRSLLAART